MKALKETFLPNYRYQDYIHWEGDWELIGGIAYAMSPAPTIEHQEINSKIVYQLMSKLKDCKNCKVLPEVDWKIDEETVVRPDTLAVCNLSGKKEYLDKTPELIFEVLSPSTKNKDRNLKSLLYATNGVKYYILVEPAGKFAEVYKLENGKYYLEGEFKEQSYTFEIESCKIEFSFKEIFEGI